MQRVTGVGGIFFTARAPEALAQWYSTQLGVDPPPESYDVSSWWQEAGPTVLAPTGHDSEHFGGGGRTWALNFRVADLDAMVEQLRGNGVVVDVDPQVYPNGRFVSLQDPEGNPLQLWQPAGADQRGPT